MTEPAFELAAEQALEPAPGTAWEPMTQRRVLMLALPIIGENLLQVAVGAIDTLLVGRLGADAIAGVGIAFETVFLIIAILSAVTIGATVLVSQAIGRATVNAPISWPAGDLLGGGAGGSAVDSWLMRWPRGQSGSSGSRRCGGERGRISAHHLGMQRRYSLSYLCGRCCAARATAAHR